MARRRLIKLTDEGADAELPVSVEDAEREAIQAEAQVAQQQVERHNDFAPPRGVVPKGMPEVSPEFARIIESIYRVEPAKTYEQLERALRLGEEGRSDYSTVNAAADDAEGNAKKAHALYLMAHLERKRWGAESAIVMAPIRSEAVRSLQVEKNKDKAEGSRSKQITDGDTEARMAELYPDEVRYHAEKSAKLKGLEEHLLNDAEIWKGRCFKLGTMLTSLRRT